MQKLKLFRLAGVLAVLSWAGVCVSEPCPTECGPRRSIGTLPSHGRGIAGQWCASGHRCRSAHVQNANGVALSNVVVTFATSLGIIAPTAVTTGIDGTATATLAATDPANVTASVGSLSAHTFVAPLAAAPALPTPSPAPGPAPTPAPPTPAVFLNVSASATTNVPLAFGVSSSATGVTWMWSFGDGSTDQTTAFNTTHTYTIAGSYTATVSAVGTAAASATILVSDPVAPKSAPPR